MFYDWVCKDSGQPLMAEEPPVRQKCFGPKSIPSNVYRRWL